MKKILKIFMIFIFAFIVFSIGKYTHANTIRKVSMDIAVDDEGTATVTEVWNCTTNQGTEVYHPYYNLGNSEITMLSVTDGTTQYTKVNSWNTSGTLESKANKFGINKISNGVELCWGMNSYGTHTYTVKYQITNFVSELTDAQMIYWTLIPYDFSNSIEDVYIKIHTNFNISDTTDVWGYGDYGAPAYVYNGYIEMQSNGRLQTSEYMTILVKFPLGTFNTTNKLNHDFEYYYEMAEEGAEKYINNSQSGSNNGIGGTLIFFICLFINIAVWGVIGIVVLGALLSRDTFNFGTEGKAISKDVPYFRDIPCNKDLFRAYHIGYQYGIIKNKTDVLGSIILKWLKDSLIRVEKRETGKLMKKEETVVILNETNPELITDKYEKDLFDMLLKASGDGILENKEFEKWCKNSYSKVLSWFDKIIDREKQELINEGTIMEEEVTKFKIFKSKRYTATPRLKEEAEQLAGLKKYLKEYTLIKDREAIEVHLFEEYLIYAQMMGIAKEVAKQFKDLYPNIIEQSNYGSYDNIIFVHMCATHGVSQASAAQARAQSYSAGGGGFSSGGGGVGSFGGGGGRRRFPLEIIKNVILTNDIFLIINGILYKKI